MYWAFCKRNFHITDDEFWSLTPTALKVLIDQYIEQWEIEAQLEDKRTALICAVIGNCFRDPKKKAYKVEDFMPKKPRPSQKSATADDMIKQLKIWNATLGGKK